MSTVTWTFEGGRGPSGVADAEPHLFVVLDCQRPTLPPLAIPLQGIRSLAVGRGAIRNLERGEDGAATLDLDDGWLSSEHFAIEETDGGLTVRDRGSKNGTYYGGHRIDEHPLADGHLIRAGATLFLYREAVPVPATAPTAFGLSTLSGELAVAFERVARAATAKVPMLVRGESGTGKEVMARAIHKQSGRKGQFVAVNCGALPENLIEAELFGAKKGAFSGADSDRPGLVKTADGGTLFLDEIAELPESSQATLLRVLQEHEVRPVGATRPSPVDLRVVAATHQDLEARCESGAFRRDLYARLLGVTVDMPPLRERREDIGLLVPVLLGRLAGDRAERLKLHPEAGARLFEYDWPLNVRELERALDAAIAVCGHDTIELDDLPETVRSPSRSQADAPETARGERNRETVEAAARAHGGNVSAMARALGTSRSQVRRLVERFAIDLDSYRN